MFEFKVVSRTELQIMRTKVSCEIMSCDDAKFKKYLFNMLGAIDDIYFYESREKTKE